MEPFNRSVNFKVYYEGYPIQITVRDENEKILPLIKKAIKAIEWCKGNGMKPSWNTETNHKWVDESEPDFVKDPNKSASYTCNECGAVAEYKEGKSAKTGKPWKAVFCKDNKLHVKWL